MISPMPLSSMSASGEAVITACTLPKRSKSAAARSAANSRQALQKPQLDPAFALRPSSPARQRVAGVAAELLGRIDQQVRRFCRLA